MCSEYFSTVRDAVPLCQTFYFNIFSANYTGVNQIHTFYLMSPVCNLQQQLHSTFLV